jgi:DNA-binding transcriptional MocR family regulator
MRKHAAILSPKFDAVQATLDRELGGKNVADWSRPAGGYFLSLNTLDGCAQAVVDLAAQAGVKLTPAGATYPYRTDPRNRNLRIAPSFPSLPEIQTAMEVVAICIQMAGMDKLLAGKGQSGIRTGA